MKKVLLPICLLFSLLTVQAQDVPEVQKTLISKISADWCPPCGTWGWNLFHDIIVDNDEEAILMAVHHSGGLETSTSGALADNFGITGQPRFYLGNMDQNVTFGNTTTKQTEIKNNVSANFAQSPLANAGLTATLDGLDLTVNTKTRFFGDADGEYYIGVYIIDDGHIGFQSQQGSNAEHERLLRDGLSDNAFGDLITNGSVSAGTEFTHNFSGTIDASWDPEKLEIATIIWRKNGNTYEFVNTHSTTQFETATPTEELFGSYHFLSMAVQPNISDAQVNVRLDLAETTSNMQLQLINLQGQVVRNIYTGTLNSGQHDFTIHRSEVAQAGLYLLTARSEKGVLSQKVVFE
ncbi:MAG: Omp28-related outer membrane protein [Bacteroidota bacterium]